MSVEVKVDDRWVGVAGNGRAEYGASTVRTGTITTDEIGIGSFALFTITFDTPMPDSDYRITWDWNTAGGNITFAIVTITEKTANGFKLYVRNSDVTANPLTSHVLTWYAFKLYTDTEYNSLLTLPDRVGMVEDDVADLQTNKSDTEHTHSTNDIVSGTLSVARGGTGNTSVDTAPTSGSTKMCTSGGIYTALSGKQGTLTVTSGNCTPNSSYLTIRGTDSIRWYKYGRIATVTVEINSSSTVNLAPNAVYVLASGAPATYGGSLANALSDMQVSADGKSYTVGNRFWVDGNGNICFFVPTNAWTGSLHFTVTYITAS